jgi:hypothetical protein
VWSLGWQLGQKTLVRIGCGFTWFQMFWVALAAAVHLCGILAFAIRSKTRYIGDEAKGAFFFQNMQAWFERWLRNEFSPCATHTTHVVSERNENY